jgi:hypothetical protein
MTTATLRTAASSFGTLAFAALRGVARGLAQARGAQARFERLQRLHQMSDEELSRRGLAREDLVRHVFRDVFAD